jgi:hypothetical protein
METFVVLFGAIVAANLGRHSDPAADGAGGGQAGGLAGGATYALIGIALACLLTSGLLRRPWGYVVGSALQVAVVGSGFWLPAMFFLGAVFAALWVTALRVGTRIERERAAFDAPGAA